MKPVNVLDLASRQADWLALRQTVIAGNIANASTPGYAARKVSDFKAALEQAQVTMQTTNAMHISDSPGRAGQHEVRQEKTWETSHSGNSVRLEQELMEASDVNRAMQLNTGVASAFYRMLAMTVRG